MNRPDRKLAAALILSGGVGMTSVQDSFIKYLAGDYPFHQMQTIRCGLALLVTTIILAMRGELSSLRVARPGLVLLRSFTLAFGSTCYYLGLSAISQADAAAIYFAMPLLVAGLSGILIGERTSPWRWMATGFGFIGVVITINPGSSVFNAASLITLFATFLYAIGHMLARPLGDTASISVMAFYQSLAFTAVALALAIIFGTGMFRSDAHVSISYLTAAWAVPTLRDSLIFLAFGGIAAVGMYVYSAAYRLASPSFVAPFEYSMIIWAIGLGYLMFNDRPKPATLIGAAIITGAGLMLIWYERASKPVVAPQAVNE